MFSPFAGSEKKPTRHSRHKPKIRGTDEGPSGTNDTDEGSSRNSNDEAQITRKKIIERTAVVARIITCSCTSYFGLKFFLGNGDVSEQLSLTAALWSGAGIVYNTLYRWNTAGSAIETAKIDSRQGTPQRGVSKVGSVNSTFPPIRERLLVKNKRHSDNHAQTEVTHRWIIPIATALEYCGIFTLPFAFLGGILGLERLLFDAVNFDQKIIFSSTIAIILSVIACQSYFSTRVVQIHNNTLALPERVIELWKSHSFWPAILCYATGFFAILGFSFRSYFTTRYTILRLLEILQMMTPVNKTFVDRFSFGMGVTNAILAPATAISSVSVFWRACTKRKKNTASPDGTEENSTKTWMIMAGVYIAMLTDVAANTLLNYEAGREFLADVCQIKLFNTPPQTFDTNNAGFAIAQLLPIIFFVIPQAVNYISYTKRLAMRQVLGH